ncbi:MAG: amidase family protein, partial [bacterium]
MNPQKQTIRQIQEKLHRNELACATLADDYLARINHAQSLNAFLAIFSDRARARAKAIDAKLKTGQAGRLAGVVVAVKDILAMKGERLTCGSRILEN